MLDKKIQLSSYYVFFYLTFLCLYFYIFISGYFDQPAPNFILEADSFTYFNLNRAYDDLSIVFFLNPNTLGPLLILRALGGSALLILIMNLSVFVICYSKITRIYNLNNKLFCILLLLNTLFIPVLTTLNKEIFGYASVIFTLVYLKEKKPKNLFISFLFALLCRWQMIFIVIFFIAFKYMLGLFKWSRHLGLVLFLLAISIIYPVLLSKTISAIADPETVEQQQATAGVVINSLKFLQDHFLYFLAILPKAFFNLIGNVFRVFTVPFRLLEGEKDLYNNIFLLGHQIMMLVVVVASIFMKTFAKQRDIGLFIILYIVLFSLGPLIQYRYFFPLYVVFCVCVTEKKITSSIIDSIKAR